MEKGIMNKGEKMKKKRRLKKWVLVVIGFMLGVIYSNLFIYSDLIKSAEASENVALVQTYSEEENEPSETKETVLVEEYVCTMDEVSCLIKKNADEYGIDYKLAIAISKHETGNYTSVAFNDNNNVGGNFRSGSLMVFENLDKGIDFFISNLKTKYIDLGLDTIEEISVKYAPIGAENDPNNLNQYWVSGVYKYYNELAK